MRNGQSFTYETDWFGVAAVAHCLLFGRYMETTQQEGGKWKVVSRNEAILANRTVDFAIRRLSQP